MTLELDERIHNWLGDETDPVIAGVQLLRDVLSTKVFFEGAPWLHDQADYTTLESAMLVREARAWSDGEKTIVELADALIRSRPVNLAEIGPHLSPSGLRHVLNAVATAAGQEPNLTEHIRA